MPRYSEVHERQVEELREAEQAVREEAVITDFLRFHIKELAPVMANRQHIVRYFNNDDITHEALADAFEHHPEFRAGFAWTTEAESRERIEAAITKLLVGSDSAIAHERAKFRYKTIEELQVWLEELSRRVQMQRLPKESIREIVKGTPSPQFQPVEPLYRNREMILSASPAEIRRLIRVSGPDAINAILSKKTDK